MTWPFSLVVKAIVLLSLLPIAPATAWAQPAPNPCPDEQVVDVASGECVPVEPAPGGAVPTTVPIDEALGDFTFLHYACDAGFDPQAGQGDRNIRCSGAGKPAFTYTISVNGQVIATATLQTSEGTRGRLDLNSTPDRPIPAGEMVIAVTPVEGWTPAWVFCEINNYDIEQKIVEPVIVNNAITVSTVAQDIVTCDWFNVPVEPAEDQGAPPVTGVEVEPGLTILVRTCPSDVADRQGDLATACTEPVPGLTFDIAFGGEPHTSQTSDEAGEVDVPLAVGSGTYQIINQPLPGFLAPSIECAITHANGTTEMTSSSGAGSSGIDVAYDGESAVTCAFYFQGEAAGQEADLPGQTLVGEQDEEQDSSEDAATGSDEADGPGDETTVPGMTLLARLCPPEVAELDVEADLTVDCTQPASGLTLEILVDGESAGTFATDANGAIAIPSEPGASQYLFRLPSIPGVTELRVACVSVYPDGTTATGRSQVMGSDMDELYLTSDGLSETTCTFFFIGGANEDQAADTQASETVPAPSLTIQFWTCPEGTDPAADPARLETTCAIDTSEHSFVLTIDGLSSGETIAGSATWEMQDLTAYVEIGPGSTGAVNCLSTWPDGADQDPATVTLEDGVLTVILPHPETAVSCNWFIVSL